MYRLMSYFILYYNFVFRHAVLRVTPKHDDDVRLLRSLLQESPPVVSDDNTYIEQHSLSYSYDMDLLRMAAILNLSNMAATERAQLLSREKLKRYSLDEMWCLWNNLYVVIHCVTLHCVVLCHATLHSITLHYITLHYITLHYITLHYITLHYITLYNSGVNIFTPELFKLFHTHQIWSIVRGLSSYTG